MTKTTYPPGTPKLELVNTVDGQKSDLYPLVLSIVAKCPKISEQIQHDDLLSVGLTALLEVEKRFDRSRGNKLSTFAYWRIRGAVYDYVEKELLYQTRFESKDPTDLAEGCSTDGLEDYVAEKELLERVMQVVENNLPEQEAVVLIRLYLEELPLEQVAQELRLSCNEVLMLRDRALQEIRRYIPRVSR